MSDHMRWEDSDQDPPDQYGKVDSEEEYLDDLANADPMDYYSEYCDWLMQNEYICNGDDLVRQFEDSNKFDQFLKDRK